MQLKNLFSFGNIRNVLIVGLIVFLTLPLLVPDEKPFSILKKENIMDRDESPLPIFPKENLVQEYTTRLKKLYHFNKTLPLYKTQQEIAEEIKNGKIYAKSDLDLIDGKIILEDNLPIVADNQYGENTAPQEAYENEPLNERAARKIHNANEPETDKSEKQNFGEYLGDLFFSEDLLGEGDSTPKSQAFIDDTVNLQRGTVATLDNMILEPTQEGYYYQGTFYKNGTYPPNANRNFIEGALKRYHVKVAGNLGKKALYFADKNGNLVVGYVNKMPVNVASDIEVYRANNPIKQNNNKAARNDTLYASSKNYGKNNKNYDRYRGARINSQNSNNNPNAMYADIAAASLKDMHAAYSMATARIYSGELGQGIHINPQNPNNSEIESALEQVNIATSTPEQPKEKVCSDNCSDSLRIAQFLGRDDILEQNFSDLDYFYHSFCSDSGCPPFVADYDQPITQDFNTEQGINHLREELSKSDKTVVELSYINEKPEYETILDNLQQQNLVNQQGKPVEILLRGKGSPAGQTESFGDKMINPFKQNIMLRDFYHSTSVQDIVSKYNQIDEEIMANADNISLNTFREISQDMLGLDDSNIQVAIVEKAPKGNNYIVNGPNIPDGYKTEIPEWDKQYRREASNGAVYYEVPKSALVKAPLSTVVILVGEAKDKQGLKIKDRDMKSVRTIPQQMISSYNYNDVRDAENIVLEAKFGFLQDQVDRKIKQEERKKKRNGKK